MKKSLIFYFLFSLVGLSGILAQTVGTPSTPTPSVTTICQGSPSTSYTTFASDATSYNWSVTGTGNSISGTGTIGTVTWAAGFSGVATVSVTANGNNGPSAAAFTTVTVLPTPTATISGTTSVCLNSSPPAITFTNPQALPVTITYNINGANQTTVNVGASTTAIVYAPTTTGGTYAYNLVSVVYQISPVCSNPISGTATVTVSSFSLAPITGATICVGSTTSINAPAAPTGGTITSVNGYRIHKFTSSGSFVSPEANSYQVLVVGGGGGGASNNSTGGGAGAGGAGGYLNTTYAIGSPSTVNVIVGNGGASGVAGTAQNGSDGSNSVFGTLTAIGGGGGGTKGNNGRPGGSGGGGGYNGYSTPRTGGIGVAGQGFNGGTTSLLTSAGGAGGGGAAGVGGSNKPSHGGGDGGLGISSSIGGTQVTYAAGGMGGSSSIPGTPSPINTGKGGDAAYGANTPYAGASGIVIVRYPDITTGAWSSSNPGVATVNPTTGVVTGVSGGTTDIIYSYTHDNITCSVSSTVTVLPTPTATISGSTSVCLNATPPAITFTNPQTIPVTITYNINGANQTTINVGASTTATVTVPTTTAGTFVYNLVSVAYQSGPSCFQTISGTATVSVLPIPTATISGTTTVCQNTIAPNITFTNPQALPVTITYNIDGANQTTVNVGASTSATVAAPTVTAGTFAYNLVSVAYQTTPTCSNVINGTATVIVTATVGTPSIPTPSETIICQGSASTTYTTFATTATSYNWTVTGTGNSISGTGTTGTVTWAAGFSGTATVSVTANGCSEPSASATTTVTVRPTPTATISGTTTICQNTVFPNITFTNPMTLPITITYNINGANQTTINVGAGTTATVSVPTGTAGTFAYNQVSVVYQTAPTCSNNITGTATIIVTPAVGAPSIPTPSGSVICQGSANTTYTTSATDAASYSWTVTGAGNSISGTGTTGTVTWAAGFSGTATVSVIASGCNAFSASVSTTVTVLPTPTATISGSTSACFNASPPAITFTNPQPYPITITYNINGSNQTTVNVGASTTAIVYAPTTTGGTYVYNLVSVVYQGTPACSNTISGSATIKVSSFNLTPITGANLCVGSTTTINPPTAPSGGTITTVGGYRIHKFTTSGSFVTPEANTYQVLVVGGGGGGASNNSSGGGAGAGGAGGYLNTTYAIGSPLTVNVIVGNGGASGVAGTSQNGSDGSNSVFGTLTAIGGGGGGTKGNNGRPGGSGGGGGYNGYSTPRTGGIGVAGQGFNGGTTSLLTSAGGAGGGGAAGVGGSNKPSHGGGDGGLGISTSIGGTLVTYAAGGMGGSSSILGAPSPINTGKGGDAAYGASTPYAGASGIVIVSYPDITTGTWSSSNPGVATVNPNTGVVAGLSAGTTEIIYSYTHDGITCSVSSTVTVYPLPTATISGTTTVCQNATAPNITFTNPQVLPVTVTYNINGANQTTVNVGASSTATVSAPTSTAGTFAYNLVSVVYQNGPSCPQTITGTATVIVTPTVGVPNIPVPSASTICQGSANTTYTTFATDATSYNWTVTGTGNTISGTGTTGTVTWVAGFSGVATVSVTANGCNGPSASASTIVTVLPTPTATISGSTTVCQNSASPDITFTNPMALPITVTYDINGGNQATVNVGANTTATVAAPTGIDGEFIYNLVSVVYQTAPACSNAITGTATVIITPTVGIPSEPISSVINICQGSSGVIFTTHATDATSYNWYITGAGNTITGTGETATATFDPGFTGTATISVTANGCNGPSDFAQTIVNVLIAPSTVLESTIGAYCGSSDGAIYINTFGGAPPYSFHWSNGSMGEDLIGVVPGIYHVTVSDIYSCTTVNNYSVSSIAPVMQEICMVTVDSASNRNMIVWEKAQSTVISHYNIWKETTQTGTYEIIGSVPYSEMSTWIDLQSDPEQRSWKYEISVVDTCGNESLLSPAHKTIHLIINLGLGDNINLKWNHYEGFDYYAYYIYRYSQSQGWVVIDSISSDMDSYTDTPTGLGFVEYRIAVKKVSVCFASSISKSTSIPFSESMSNTVANGSLGIQNLNGTSDLNVYPNPFNDKTTIEFSNHNNSLYIMNIYDITGKLIRVVDNIKGNKIEIERGNLNNGFYTIELKGEKVFRGKIIVN